MNDVQISGLEDVVDDISRKKKQDFAEEQKWVAGMKKDMSQFRKLNYTFLWASKQNCLTHK